MKIIAKIILFIFIIWLNLSFSYANRSWNINDFSWTWEYLPREVDWYTNWWSGPTDLRTITENSWRWDNNEYLDTMWWWQEFFQTSAWWEKWIKYLILNIARDLKIIIFTIVLIVVLVMVFKLIFWENSDEERKKLKMWIIWASIWIIVMQTAYSFYKILFDQWVWSRLWERLAWEIIQPFVLLLTTIAPFAFVAVWIYAFYKIITAAWDEEKISKWKHAIIHAIMWFIVIKISWVLVKNTFEPNCWWNNIINYWWIEICENIGENAKIIMVIINWLNTFIWILVVIMTIYAWFLYLTSSWDEEKQSKAKKIILYIWIWLLILFVNYLIVTFFINPDAWEFLQKTWNTPQTNTNP